MLKINCEYMIKEDIDFLMEAEKLNKLELSEKTTISRATLDEIRKTGKTNASVYEKFYSFAYANNYRINRVKEELTKEKYQNVLFHGSKAGLSKISISSSRENCDFGQGFYLGESYHQALAFVCEYPKSSVYSFRYCVNDLNVIEFDCSLEWMLAICYYRGILGRYAESDTVHRIISRLETADIIIAPIADNKMFYIMAQFADGEINADAALHSLAASKLGRQYIFKTDQSLKALVPIEKYYLCVPERKDCINLMTERSYEIDTKLKLSKREYRSGLYIEEILK